MSGDIFDGHILGAGYANGTQGVRGPQVLLTFLQCTGRAPSCLVANTHGTEAEKARF